MKMSSGWSTFSSRTAKARTRFPSYLWSCFVTPVRKALRFTAIFFLLLCAAESLLSLAVYMGYSGGTYVQRVNWHRNGSLSFAEFQREVGNRVPTGLDRHRIGSVSQDEDLQTVTVTAQRPKHLPPCPLVPPDLQGPVSPNMSPPPSFRELEETFSMLSPGGRYHPPECRAKQKLAVIVPYRDRRVHLKLFLRNMHPFLQKQQLDYAIFVVELKEGIDFNRALLFNIGFLEAVKADNYTCFVFHDVDLLPEDDRNLYRCSDQPRHMSVAVDRMKYKLPYNQIFGGVSALSRRQFQELNGFSNMYFGWGGEDDDMFRRIRSRNMKVVRYTGEVARYKSMAHAKADKNPSRIKLLKQGPKRFLTDGLNSITYTRHDIRLEKLYTWVLVSVDQKVITARFRQDKSATKAKKT